MIFFIYSDIPPIHKKIKKLMLKLGTLRSWTVLSLFYVKAPVAMIRNAKLKFGLSQLSFSRSNQIL